MFSENRERECYECRIGDDIFKGTSLCEREIERKLCLLVEKILMKMDYGLGGVRKPALQMFSCGLGKSTKNILFKFVKS